VLVLAIDTSSPAVIAAVVEVTADGSEVRAHRETVNPRGHSELLAPAIADVLAAAGATPRDIGAVVAGTGPGPYTGLRVGLVTAAAFADAGAIPAYGVCSLDAIAPTAPDRGQSDLVVATDARRGEVYWARYDAHGERIDGPHVARPEDVPTEGRYALAGAGARLYQERFGRAPIGADYPDPGALVAGARARILDRASSEVLTPLYLRRPDAVPPSRLKPVSQ
jgi:tRNA threonylcarbamoyl adenosine modification protein YeaZ